MKNINTTETTACVCFKFGSVAYVGVTLYDGLTVDECIAIRSDDIEEYKIEGGEWTTKKATADEARAHLAELRNAEVEAEAEQPAGADEKEKAAHRIEAAREALTTRKDRSAWDRGVTAYALELLDTLDEAISGGYDEPDTLAAPKMLDRAMLNGARDWSQYSWGGSALIYDGDIAERLCSPSELKRTRNGECRPNSREEWLDTQARALNQAAARVRKTLRAIIEAEAAA